MEDEIDLRDVFDVLWRRRLLIIGIFLIAILVAGAISFSMPPIFRAGSIVALGNFNDTVYSSQASAKKVMLSDEFLLDVIKNLNMNSDRLGEFKENVKIEPVKDTNNLLEISIESQSRTEGKEIVEGIVRFFANRSEERYNKHKKILSEQLAITKEILSMVDVDINQTHEVLKDIEAAPGLSSVEKDLFHSHKIDYLRSEELQRLSLLDRCLYLQKQLIQLTGLEVVQEPREPLAPIKSQRTRNMAVAGVLGLIVGIFAAFLREGLGKRTK